jgi:hypothetical protein
MAHLAKKRKKNKLALFKGFFIKIEFQFIILFLFPCYWVSTGQAKRFRLQTTRFKNASSSSFGQELLPSTNLIFSQISEKLVGGFFLHREDLHHV